MNYFQEMVDLESIKRAHHYVWRHYLEAWEVDGRLCCLRDKQVKRINAIKLAIENDFYRLPELNDAELQFVVRMAQSMPSHGRKVFNNFITYFTASSHIRRILADKIDDYMELDIALRAYEANTEEDWHNSVENLAIRILDEIKNGDISFYTDRERSANLCIL